MNRRIELYIDKLVLYGFKPNQKQQITQAVNAELTRLFSHKGIPGSLQSGGNIPLIKASDFNMNKQAKAKAVGNKIAGSVYKSFGK